MPRGDKADIQSCYNYLIANKAFVCNAFHQNQFRNSFNKIWKKLKTFLNILVWGGLSEVKIDLSFNLNIRCDETMSQWSWALEC